MINTLGTRLSVILATWFGVGRIPVAPGTFGSLAAVVCAVPLIGLGGTPALAFAAAFVSLLGIPISSHAEKTMQRKDPGCIVIDEVAGQWIALLPAAPNLTSYAIAFTAFRTFDILKPGPVGWADRSLGKGLGIMADDIIAGGLAAAVVALLGPFLPPIIRFF
ncbi:MAG: phosphatidylglycerophosphatase A [Rhodospirillaceae bacterium]|nr:phosphatidylglycerophosphatase A [Rhodospirillaceae bacterium]